MLPLALGSKSAGVRVAVALLAGLVWGSYADAAPARYAGLTSDNRIELFDAEGNFLESRTFGNPTNIDPATRIGIAFGDVLPSNPGSELVVLRDLTSSLTGTIDIYPDPTTAAGNLDRLFSANLLNVGNREPLSIDIADFVPSNPGMEIVALVRDPSLNPQQPFVHIYGALPATSGGTVSRIANGFYSLTNSAQEPLNRITVGELAPGLEGLEIATAAESNWNELFASSSGLGTAAVRTDVFQTGTGLDVISLKAADGQLFVLSVPNPSDANQQYLLNWVVPVNDTGDLTLGGGLRLQDNPNGRSTFVDFAIVPEPASAALLGIGSLWVLARNR